MELLQHLALGFHTALSAQNLLYAFLGCVFGTLIGVLPGLGPTATIAMLLPVTYGLEPTPALIMLAGIYYGAQYGGSTTSILINLPGEASSVVTTLDGYQMARQGRAGQALAVSALGSFFAGCMGVLMLAAFAAPLASLAFEFGPAEYFALMTLGLTSAVVLASGPLLRAVGMIAVGLLLGLMGSDVNSGILRFDMDIPELADGIDVVVIAMGMFGLGDILANMSRPEQERQTLTRKVSHLYLSMQEIREAFPAVVRGTGLGLVLGLLPGGGSLLAPFAAYSLEKRIGRRPAPAFGQGNIRGVASPESANNAGAQASFIPLLTLGIPPTAVMALMLGAMMMHNIQPGPQILSTNPSLFWGLVASMWIGNLMLVVLNLPFIGIWVQLLSVPYRYLMPAIVLFCAIGVFSINNSAFDVWLLALFGAAGYVFQRLECEVTPMLLGFILGPMMEENLRRALVLSDGHGSGLVQGPIALGLLALSVLLFTAVAVPAVARRRREAFTE